MVRLGIALAFFALLGAAPASAHNSISATLRATPGKYFGACPADISFAGAITVPRKGEVEYRFVRSDGGAEPSQKLYFDAPGSLPVGMTWHVRKVNDHRGWVAIEILEPLHLQSTPAVFDLRCGRQAGTRGPMGIIPNDNYSDGTVQRDGGFLSSLPMSEPTPVISLGPKYDPYLRWNGERIAGTPALEARLRDYRRENMSCSVRIAPDRNADYQMVASLMSVITRTDDCRTVEVGLLGSIGKAARFVQTTNVAEGVPIITVGPRGQSLQWNGERLSGPDALERRLGDHKRRHDDCEVRIDDRGANYPAISVVFDSMIRTGCSLAIGRAYQPDATELPY